MDSIYALKGKGKRLLTLSRGDMLITLILYVDASMGITQGETVLGVWEPYEQDACLEEFVRLAGGRDQLLRALVVCRTNRAATATASAVTQWN